MANKRLFFILPLILALALVACAGPSAQPIPTITPRIYVPASPTDAHTPPPASTSPPTPTPAPSLTPTKVFDGNMEKGDYLIYRHNGGLFFYNPVTNIHIPILIDWEIADYTVSMNDQIAFSSPTEGNQDIYILDYPYWENTPENITNTPNISEKVDSWSPNSHVLVFEAFEDTAHHLIVWDKQEFKTLYQFELDESLKGSNWNKDSHYAFTSSHLPKYNNGNLFVWNGTLEQEIFIVSHNPSGRNMHPQWSREGKLAFLSEEEKNNDSVYTLKIWDGASMANGHADEEAFLELGEGIVDFWSNFTWTDHESIIFFASGRERNLYEWDGENVQLLDIPQDFGHMFVSWGPNEYWVTTDAIWDPSNIYIHNQNNETILISKGGPGLAWSPDGNLAYCMYDHESHNIIISVWDRKNVIYVINDHFYLEAKWKNGNAISCGWG